MTTSVPYPVQLIFSLGAVLDVRQRSYAICRRLKQLGDDQIIDALKQIMDGAVSGLLQYRSLYNAVIVPGIMVDVFGSQRVSCLVKLSQDREEFAVASVLLDLPSSREDVPHQPYSEPALKEIPLGMKKSLAKKPDFKLIQKIAKDQDHRVIRILLDNQRLTENDVLKIGSTRPTSPKIIEEIYSHRKWIQRYSVKKCIVLNPYSPLSVSLRMIRFLTLADLDLVISSTELDPYLIVQAERLIQQKHSSFRTT